MANSQQMANAIRALAMDAVQQANSGHPGAPRGMADMAVALRAIEGERGGICVVRDGVVTAMVPLPVAGLMSDKRVHLVAGEVQALKVEWEKAGCTLPYMGFNLIPLSVIPEIRITDKGMVLVPEMTQVPLFEAAE